ncbi:olfactory receptor 13A1-like protein [Cricetulus griseus]|nr:olfactory receptor 13A1-like protein [Cricetulus griseus]
MSASLELQSKLSICNWMYMGNTLIIMAISLNPSLHTPMYFFLANLALLDIVCTSTVLPKLLEGLVGLTEPDTFSGRQKPPPGPGKGVIYIYPTGLITHKEWLRVTKKKWTVVDRGNTLIIMAISLNPSLHTPMYFFLANLALLDIVCTSTVLPKLLEGLVDVYFGVVNFLLTMVSYSFIIASILRIRSAEGKRRAFSTCSAHLVVVTLYYSTVIYTYVQPGSGSSLENGKVVALLYTAVSPTLNPLIYSLRNKDVKVALRKVFPCVC